MPTLLRCGLRLHAIGEYAKRLLAHSPTVISELKPRIYQEIIIQNEKKFDSFYLDYTVIRIDGKLHQPHRVAQTKQSG
jgi:hypothetical protein